MPPWPYQCHVPLAQLDRALVYETGGSGFNSSAERHLRIAQSGRVLPSEGRGRRIEACYADQILPVSFNGRTARSERANGGSNPSTGANLRAGGEVGTQRSAKP